MHQRDLKLMLKNFSVFGYNFRTEKQGYYKNELTLLFHNEIMTSMTLDVWICWIQNNAYVFFFFSCTSYVGKTGQRQMLSLARGCWYTATVAHEFGMLCKLTCIRILIVILYKTSWIWLAESNAVKNKHSEKKKKKGNIKKFALI